MNPKIKELQRKIDNAISQKKKNDVLIFVRRIACRTR